MPSLRRHTANLATLLALACTATPAAAQSCVGFTDVLSTSAFCPSVEWIKNRKVTVGCIPTEYCPNAGVSRLQMAAFMTRLGAALTPLVLNIANPSAALVLDATPVVCQTTDQAIIDFPRRALVDASLAGTGPAGVDLGVRAVYSTDAGATWQTMHAVQPAGFVPAAQWGQVSDIGVLDLAVGATVRFGVQAARVGAGTANLSDSRCHLRASIGSRDGTTSPL